MAATTQSKLAESQHFAGPIGQGELILVVDDETTVLEIAKLTLETHHYKVLTARDGAQGLSLYQQHREQIKLVLTDLMMPIMDGAAMIKALHRIDPQVKQGHLWQWWRIKSNAARSGASQSFSRQALHGTRAVERGSRGAQTRKLTGFY